MSLVQAIDKALGYVRAHRQLMTRKEVEEFRQLAESVYILATRAGLQHALPQVPELRPQLESTDPNLALPPVQFETKLNVPGDWDVTASDDDEPLPSYPLLPLPETDGDDLRTVDEREFLVCARETGRWFNDMATLRKLAETAVIPAGPISLTDEDRLTKPKKPLTDWHEITFALEMEYHERNKIKALNERFNGPITHRGKGTRPIVYRDALLEWWNNLEIQAQDLANRREGARLSAATQYNYGRRHDPSRTPIVAPEISGSVKKRRRDKSA